MFKCPSCGGSEYSHAECMRNERVRVTPLECKSGAMPDLPHVYVCLSCGYVLWYVDLDNFKSMMK